MQPLQWVGMPMEPFVSFPLLIKGWPIMNASEQMAGTCGVQPLQVMIQMASGDCVLVGVLRKSPSIFILSFQKSFCYHTSVLTELLM